MEPLRMSVTVACPPAHAFRVFTALATRWWPPRHTATGERAQAVVFEPRVGGRVFERTPGGEEIPWGEVLVWDPPARLGYRWHLRSDPADATEVQIAFVPDGTATRVEIEHRGFERLGERGADWREANRGGWGGLLPHFADACTAPALEAS
jgi:uncharacterized protein YndB with AHSA1/START domain